MGAFSDASSVF
jgi:hypothetical protein